MSSCALVLFFSVSLCLCGPSIPAPERPELAILTDAAGRATVRRANLDRDFPIEPLMSLGASDRLTLAAGAEAVVVFNTGQVAALKGPATFVIEEKAVKQTAPKEETVALRGAAGDAALSLVDTKRLVTLADAGVTRKESNIRLGVPYRDILSNRPAFRWTTSLAAREFSVTLFKDDQRTVLQRATVTGLALDYPKDWPALQRGRTYYWSVSLPDGAEKTRQNDFTVVDAATAQAEGATVAAIRQAFGTNLTSLRLIADHLIKEELYADALPYAVRMADVAPKSRRALITLKAVYTALELAPEAKALDARLKALDAAPASQSAPALPRAADLDRARQLIDEGRYEEARTLLTQLNADLARDSAPERRLARAAALKLTGILHYRLGAGAAREAADFYDQALACLDPMPDALRPAARREAVRIQNDAAELRLRTGESRALDRSPNLFLVIQDYRDALKRFEAAIADATAIDDRAGLSDTRANLAGFYRSFGDFYQLIQKQENWADQYYAKALAEHQAALTLERGLAGPRPINLGRNELGIGNVLFRQGKYAEAGAAFERAAAAFKDQAEPFYAGLESAYRNLGLAALARRGLPAAAAQAGGADDAALVDRALEFLKLAAAMGAHLRTQIAPGLAGRFRASLFNDRVYVQEKLVELLVERRDAAAAFAYAEEAKARAFLDLLGAARTSSRPGSHARPARGGVGAAAAEEAVLKEEDPAPAASLDQVRSILDPDTALVEYVVGRDAAFVFVLAKGELTAQRLAVDPAELVRKVVDARMTIAKMGFERGPSGVRIDPAWQDRLAELHALLIAPIQARVKTARHLVIVPHHVLHYLPFGALVTAAEKDPPAARFAQPRFLIETPVDIAYAPSASALFYARQYNTGRLESALILANAVYPHPWPALPGTEREAEGAAPLFRSRLLKGPGATETALKTADSNYDILYLATHGKLDPAAPLDSYLLLSPTAQPPEDGYLRVTELFGLAGRLRANLVVLSACQSGLSDPSPQAGDDLVGLSRAFLAAGSPSVVSTLWSVSDRTSAILMLDFFKGLKGGADKARALADAQRSMISKARQAGTRDVHPFYWAPFVLSGDPRARIEG